MLAFQKNLKKGAPFFIIYFQKFNFYIFLYFSQKNAFYVLNFYFLRI